MGLKTYRTRGHFYCSQLTSRILVIIDGKQACTHERTHASIRLAGAQTHFFLTNFSIVTSNKIPIIISSVLKLLYIILGYIILF